MRLPSQESTRYRLHLILPTERFIKKFIGSKIIVEPEYVLSTRDIFGAYLFQILAEEKKALEFTDEKYNDHIKIIIPHCYQYQNKFEFRPKTIDACNAYLKQWFYENFIHHVNVCSMFSVSVDKTILSFCKNNNLEIDVDIQFETLRKKYYRWREKNGQPISKYILEKV